MKLNIAFWVVLSAPIGLMCCNKKDTREVYQVPLPIFFVVKKNGQRLPDSVLNYMSLTYLKNGTRTYVNDFGRGSNDGAFSARDLGVQVSMLVGVSSGKEGIKTYYLEYPDGDVDTLMVDYQYLEFDDAVKHPCRCKYPFIGVTFNRQTPVKDPTITVQNVWVFNKP
jgi:hypothetical protein